MLPNIGLVGRAGSGKGVLAAQLVERGNYVVSSFASPVKSHVGEMILKGAALTEYVDPVEFVTANKAACRPMLQAYGTAMRTLVAADHWINIALEYADAANADGYSVVIDDARFLNEVIALKASGFRVFGVHRPWWHYWLNGTKRLPLAQRRHVSERVSRLPVDRWIRNDSDYATLERRLGVALNG